MIFLGRASESRCSFSGDSTIYLIISMMLFPCNVFRNEAYMQEHPMRHVPAIIHSHIITNKNLHSFGTSCV